MVDTLRVSYELPIILKLYGHTRFIELDEILINTEDLKLVILFGEVSCNLAFNCESIISPSINQLMHKQSLKKELWETIKNKLNI